MGRPVRDAFKDRLELVVPLRLSVCPGSAGSPVSDFPADERRGVFRIEPGAEVHGLSSAGEFAVRDSHRFGRKSDNRQASVSIPTRENLRGSESYLVIYVI